MSQYFCKLINVRVTCHCYLYFEYNIILRFCFTSLFAVAHPSDNYIRTIAIVHVY